MKEGYFILGDLPQSGAVPAMRTGGQLAGFLAAVEGFPDDHVIKIDTKNTLEESFTQTNNVLGRIPAGVPIMATAINDQATTGILRAVKQAGREADLIVVGMGADETADHGGRADLRRLGRLLPGALRQLPDPDGAGRARRQRPAADGAADPRHGRQGQRLRVLPGLRLRRRRRAWS